MYPIDLPALGSSPSLITATPLMPQDYVHPGMSLTQLASILWAYRKQSLLIAGAVILLVGIACSLWPRTYVATATLMVNYEITDPLAGKEFPSGLLGSYMSTQVELLRGSEVLGPVIDRLNLSSNKEYTSGYSGRADGLRDWIETRVRKNLLVEQGLFGSLLIYVKYGASNPAEAAQVANTIAEVYSEQQYKRLSGPASERAHRYTEQIVELKSKVAHAQDQLADFRQRSGILDSESKNNGDMQLLSTLEQRLLDAQNARRIAETRSSADQLVGSQVLNSPMIQSTKTQLALQESHMAELLATMGPRHPQVLELQSELNTTRRTLNTELHEYSSNAASELASSQLLEKKLQKAVDDQRNSAIKMRPLQDEGVKYQLELDSAQAVYKRALDGYDQVMFASTGGYTNISMVGRAKPPPEASKPKVALAMLLACVLGGALGLTIPLCYELLNRRVRCRDDMERDHGIPVLIELGSTNAIANFSMRGTA